MRMRIVRYRTTVDSATAGNDSSASLRRAADMRLVEDAWILGDFPVSLWSHYDNIEPRTTNVAEGFHNGLNSRFRKSHPSLVFLD